jgi:hypothetical protein
LGNLIFLVGAIGLSIVGSTLLWLRYRKPTSFMSSIDDFRSEMSALGGERPAPGPAPSTPALRPERGRPGVRPNASLADRIRAARARAAGNARPGAPTGPPTLTRPQGSTVRPTRPGTTDPAAHDGGNQQ